MTTCDVIIYCEKGDFNLMIAETLFSLKKVCVGFIEI